MNRIYVCKCGDLVPNGKSFVSWQSSGLSYREISANGQCAMCKGGFCVAHYGRINLDDDSGGLGCIFYCLKCTHKHEQETHAQLKWWKDHIPVLGGCIGWIVTACCRPHISIIDEG